MSFLSNIQQSFAKLWNDTNGEHFFASLAIYALALHWTLWYEALTITVGLAFVKEVVLDKWIGALTGYQESWSHSLNDLMWWGIALLVAFVAH